MKRILDCLPWKKSKFEDAPVSYEQELDEVQMEENCEREGRSNSLANSCDELDALTDIHSVFSAIQQYDNEEVARLLELSPGLVNEIKCGGLTPLHVACHVKNLQILKLILSHGAQVSQLDDVGNTALHIVIAEGWHDGLRELLQHGASPDTRCQPLETPGGEVITETPLQSAVRRGDYDSTVLLLEHNPDLRLRDSNQCSILHLAAQSLNVKILSHLLAKKQCQDLLGTSDCRGNSLMHAALISPENAESESSLKEVLRALFEAGIDVNSVNLQNESLIFLAARRGLDKTVEFILSLGAELKVLTSKKQSLLHAACIGGNAACLDHLLNTGSLFKFVTQADEDGEEPFHYAVRSCSIDCCELLLNNGDHLTRKDKNGITRCSLILDYLPTATELLKSMFDNCITTSDKPQHDPDFRITFNYSILLPPSKVSQSSLMSNLKSNCESESLIKHPLVESFLYIKWNKIKVFFYTNVLIFFLFLLLHSFYIISVYRRNPMAIHHYVLSVWVFRFLHILMYMLILVPEVIMTISHPKRHTKHWESLTKCISLISSAFVVFAPDSLQQGSGDELISPQNATISGMTGNGNLTSVDNDFSFQRHVAAISAFFGWVELMMLCGRFPALGVYALMFTRIAKSMLLFILAFITLLIGFAVCFMVLFYKLDLFSSFWKSIMKTLMMMVGEIDYADIVDEKTPVISYLVLVVFLFLVSILVVNLLIGLAVNDITDLEFQGEIERLSKQASFLISLEELNAFLTEWRIFPRRLTKFIDRSLEITRIRSISLNKRRFKTSSKYKIPAEIIEAALAIGSSNGDKEHEKEVHNNISKLLRMIETLHPELK